MPEAWRQDQDGGAAFWRSGPRGLVRGLMDQARETELLVTSADDLCLRRVFASICRPKGQSSAFILVVGEVFELPSQQTMLITTIRIPHRVRKAILKILPCLQDDDVREMPMGEEAGVVPALAISAYHGCWRDVMTMVVCTSVGCSKASMAAIVA